MERPFQSRGYWSSSSACQSASVIGGKYVIARRRTTSHGSHFAYSRAKFEFPNWKHYIGCVPVRRNIALTKEQKQKRKGEAEKMRRTNYPYFAFCVFLAGCFSDVPPDNMPFDKINEQFRFRRISKTPGYPPTNTSESSD